MSSRNATEYLISCRLLHQGLRPVDQTSVDISLTQELKLRQIFGQRYESATGLFLAWE